uniref:Dolichyl-diphosphooligosaccharide--protein glycosyltransferase subunit STT3B n=1 Tax=Lygus hesperus TaxID=30085 RepID=A0A146LBT2_LYGHE
MGDRTVYVDNNTNDYFQIATVGLVLASTEKRAYQILQMWDTDYVLIFQSSMFSFGADDINKFLWMVRICNGYYPEVEEVDYLNDNGIYRVGNEASKRFRESLMYKMVYYNLPSQNGEIFDRTRKTPVTISDIDLRYLEEAYTTSNYLVRIYRVKKETDRGFVEELDMQRASLST